jgi:hypothetical protein
VRNWLILFAATTIIANPSADAKKGQEPRLPSSLHDSPMRFSYEGADQTPCSSSLQNQCRIVAEGVITADTPQIFEDFLIQNSLKSKSSNSTSIVLSSPGGDLGGALELGRKIYALKFNTYLSRDIPSGIACPGSKLLERAYQIFPKLRQDFPGKCLNFNSLHVRTRCESACAFVFAAGRRRALGGNWALIQEKNGSKLYASHFTGVDDEQDSEAKSQRQLGFHAMDPQADVRFDREQSKDVLRIGAIWGQREQIKVSEYLREIRVDSKILDFTAQPPNEPNGYYYPSLLELERVGLLSVSSFADWDLVVSGNAQSNAGVLLAAQNRNPDSENARISIFCSLRSKQPGTLYIALSRRFWDLLPVGSSLLGDELPRDDAQALGTLGLDEVSLDPASSIAGNDLAFRISLDGQPREMQWGATIQLDSRFWFSGEQYFTSVSNNAPWVLDSKRSHPSLIKAQSKITTTLVFNQLIIAIAPSKVPELLAARSIITNINSGPAGSIELKLDHAMRRKLDLVRNNCLH